MTDTQTPATQTPRPARPVISGREATDAAPTRDAEIRRFVRQRYGLRGTLALHREALGWDLLRAPVNVAMSPLFLIVKLLSALLSVMGAKRAAAWLSGRQIFLTSNVAQRIEADLQGFVADLDRKGIGPAAPPDRIRREIAEHAEIRNAVAEITTSVMVFAAGLLMFRRATPGVISLAGPLAEMRAHGSAVENFWLGDRLGRAWYWAFPVELSPWQVIATGVVLALIASLITTFAGLIADPVQSLTGTHRRRLTRLLERLDQAGEQPSSGLAREHILARVGDLSDAALSVLRSWRG
ncbi:DUF6635 family protein [Paracoccus sp. SCSIO 75233]|uniref:DUF6635 family protein n=1 Tax=Paracoccus sp. SCSIO 75233 TaxID=3017782 RepID=UPI0022F07660|nr:DUF6635 family protein [Paracoccus sp. SCSIO 75233]WBU53791.1 hypothetical protein PAF12_02815 [Paracoccus sp. SCSIO 75233]